MIYYIVFSYLFVAGVTASDKEAELSHRVISLISAPISFPIILGYCVDKFCQWMDRK